MLDAIMVECKPLPEFSVMIKSARRQCCKKLELYYKRCSKKGSCINSSMLILCLPPATLLKMKLRHRYFRIFSACNIKNETPTQFFLCEF